MGNEDSIPQPSSFVEISRTWNSGDTIEVALPKTVHLEPTPDDRRIAAIMWGPLVLAGDLGPRRESRGEGATGGPAPMLLAAERPVSEWVLPGSRAGDFQVRQIGRVITQPTQNTDVALTPFYRTHERTYSVYFDVITPSEFEARVAAVAAERERMRRMEAATVAYVRPGDQQTEANFGYKSEPADRQVTNTNRRPGRGGPGWFSYDLAVDSASPRRSSSPTSTRSASRQCSAISRSTLMGPRSASSSRTEPRRVSSTRATTCPRTSRRESRRLRCGSRRTATAVSRRCSV